MTAHLMPTRAAHGRGSTLWRGLGALVALVALVVGPPVALLIAVGNPIPDHAIVAGQLTDAGIIGLLAGVVWLAWAQLTVVITVECTAALRGRTLPRTIPGCGVSQHLARRLVVTASLLLAGTGPLIAATASASPAVAAVAPVACLMDTSAAPTDVVDRQSSTTDHRPASVPRIVTSLNFSPDRATKGAEPEEVWYVVASPQGHHHDSLWDIAERHLGDGLRWREIYDLNRHRPQPDGQRLELARLIQPGWRLLMPADARGLPTEQSTPRPKAEATPRVTGALPPAAEPAPLTQEDLPAAAKSSPLPQARRVPGGVTAGPPSMLDGSAVAVPSRAASAGPVAAPAPSGVEVAAQDDDVVPFGQLALGLGAIACAGLLAEMARRRRRAQRFRRPGERLPRLGETAAAAERQVRAANAELTVVDLRDALRLLAAQCRAEDRDLPDVHAITLNASTATLHLGRPAEPVAPFVPCGTNTLRLDLEQFDGTDRAELDEHGIDPYPALVSLGVTDDAVLLVNLEAAGTLALTGAPDETTPMLNALIAELGTSLLSSTVHLVLTDCPPELLAMLDSGRVTVIDAEQAQRWAGARGSDVATILLAAEAADLGSARARGVADDVWAPAVLIIGASAIDATDPAVGISVVRTAQATDTGWVVRRSGHGWELDPLGLVLTPQRLDLAEAGPLTEALATVAQPATFPEDAPVQTHPATQSTTSMKDDPTDDVPGAAPRARALVMPRQPEPEPVEPLPSAPRVLVLGPVEIVGVSDDGAPGRKRRATELVAYLALHPGATQYQLDEALWPGCRVSRNTRNPLVSRTRQWLGTNGGGEPYLSMVAESGHYGLAPDVGCDWHDFERLAQQGLEAEQDGLADLEAALRLVRGRPFLGVNPAAYGWAEAITQDMISAIVDVAHEVAVRSLQEGEARRARWAAARGLAVDPIAEMLYADAIEATRRTGDQEDERRLVDALRRGIGELDPADDMGPEERSKFASPLVLRRG